MDIPLKSYTDKTLNTQLSQQQLASTLSRYDWLLKNDDASYTLYILLAEQLTERFQNFEPQ